jgi:hypothetical protein
MSDEKDSKSLKYYPAPPFILSYHKYPKVNVSEEIILDVTEYYLNKLNEWFKKDISYNRVKKLSKYLKKNKDGMKTLHKLLRLIVKKTELNWFDLKYNEIFVKDYIRDKLESYI